MPALVPGIQALLAAKEGVEGRDNAMSRLDDKPGHDVDREFHNKSG
jgi:hypothetical protein